MALYNEAQNISQNIVELKMYILGPNQYLILGPILILGRKRFWYRCFGWDFLQWLDDIITKSKCCKCVNATIITEYSYLDRNMNKNAVHRESASGWMWSSSKVCVWKKRLRLWLCASTTHRYCKHRVHLSSFSCRFTIHSSNLRC